jgi:hypothetical protein
MHSLPLVDKDWEGASDGISQKTCQRHFGPWSLQEHKAGILRELSYKKVIRVERKILSAVIE